MTLRDLGEASNLQARGSLRLLEGNQEKGERGVSGKKEVKRVLRRES